MSELDAEMRTSLLHDMVLLRRFEERCAQLYQESKIRGFMHLYVGEEAVAVGIARALQPQDNAVGTYREHGHALMKGVDAGAIMAEMFGRVDGCSRGRGGSMHLFDVDHGRFMASCEDQCQGIAMCRDCMSTVSARRSASLPRCRSRSSSVTTP